MSRPNPDPLLRAATVLINVALFILVVCAIVLLLVFSISFFTQDRLFEAGNLSIKLISITGPTAIIPLAIMLIGLAFQFVRELRRIVASVREGEPFTSVNADRLRNMAWLVLAMQGLEIQMQVLSYTMERRAGELAGEVITSGVGGLLLALVLFVLARVFRVGTEMRDELEGTV